MDISLEVGASAPDFIKSLREARNEFVGIRDENLKLNQELKARLGESVGAGEKLTQTFVGANKALEVQRKLSQDVRAAMTSQATSGKAAGDVIIKSTQTATTELEKQRKTVDALKASIDNLKKNGVTGAAVTNTQNALDSGQAKLIALETTALAENTEAIVINEEKTLSLKAQKRQLAEQIGALLLAGKQESQEFQDLTAKAGQLDDAIRDANAAIKLTGSDTRGLDTAVQVVGGLAGGFSAAQGAAALFGQDNEVLQESLLKVNAAMSIANGLEQIGNVVTNERIKADVLRYLGQVKQNVQQAISNGLESESVIVRTASTVAQRALNLAMAENPMFAVAAALAVLGTLFLTYKLTIGDVTIAEQKRKDTLEALRKVQADAASATIQQTVALNSEIAVLNDGNASIEQKREAYKKIKDQYPEYLGFLDRETLSTKEGSAAIEKQIALIAKKQLVISSEKALTEALENQSKAQAALSDEQNIFQKGLDAFGGFDLTSKYGAIAEAGKKVAIATDVYKKAQDGLNGASHRTTDELKAQIEIYQTLAKSIPGYAQIATAAISQLNNAIAANKPIDDKKQADRLKQSLAIQLAATKDNSRSQLLVKQQQVDNEAKLAKLDAAQTILDDKDLKLKEQEIDATAAKAHRDLNKEYAAATKERLQSQIDANNKLLEAQLALKDAQLSIQKETLEKDLEIIRLDYKERIAGVEQSIKAEQLRIQANEKITAQEKAAVISANEVRKKLILQLRANEAKELADAELKYVNDRLKFQLQYEGDYYNLQKDSLDKTTSLIEIDYGNKIAGFRETYKNERSALAQLETQALEDLNRKIKAAKAQFELDQLEQSRNTATKSIALIQFNAQNEGRITRLKNDLIAKIEADAAKQRLQVLKKQFDTEGKLEIDSIINQFSNANIISAAKQGVDIFDFLGIKLEGSPEEVASAKTSILSSVEQIKAGVKTEAQGKKIDIFKLIFNTDKGSFDANAAQFDQAVDKTREAVTAILDIYNSFLDARLAQQQKEIDQDNARLTEAEQALADELAFKKNGYANNVKAKQEEVDKIKKQRDEDTAHLKEIQKEQAKVGIAMQATALAVSIAKMIEAVAAIINSGAESGGYVGAIAAVVAAAGVVAGFVGLSNQVKAYKSLKKGGDLSLMDALNGQPSHEQGGVDVVNRKTGQKLAELEGNEKLFVVNKGSSARYHSLLKAINNGSIENWGIGDFARIQPGMIKATGIQLKEGVLPGLIALGDQEQQARRDVRVIHGGYDDKYIHRIAASNEAMLDLERDRETLYQDGEDLIILKGNHKRRIKKNSNG